MFESRCLVGWRDRESGRRDQRDGGRERSREHGSGSAVSLGANESHLGERAPGVRQQAFRLLEQLQHTVRPPLLMLNNVCAVSVDLSILHLLKGRKMSRLALCGLLVHQWCCVWAWLACVSLTLYQGCSSHLTHPSFCLLSWGNNLDPQLSHVSIWYCYFWVSNCSVRHLLWSHGGSKSSFQHRFVAQLLKHIQFVSLGPAPVCAYYCLLGCSAPFPSYLLHLQPFMSEK